MAFDLENFPTSETAKRMIGYVSEDFYFKSYVAKWLYQVMGLELDEAWEIVESLPEQAFPETATWGLMYHEIKWGLPIRDNLSYEERRQYIFEKRDIKKPVNPWKMERIVYTICGREAYIRDSNDDPAIPTNTFVLDILNGDTAVDLGAVIRQMKAIKQSHVTFSVRVCASSSLVIKTKRTAWRKRSVVAGTLPMTSRGLGIHAAELDIVTGETAISGRYPLANASGEAGMYPKTSRILQWRDAGLYAATAEEAYLTDSPVADASGDAGTYPEQSRGLQQAGDGAGISVTTAAYKSSVKYCGSSFDISQ